MNRQSARPPRRAAFRLEGPLSLHYVPRVVGQADDGYSHRNRLGSRQFLTHPQRPHRALYGQRRLSGDHASRPARLLKQVSFGGHLRYKSDLVGAPGRHSFMVSEQRHAHDLLEWHLLQHVDGLERGDQPVGDMRVEERRILARDHEVHLAKQVERTATGHTVDGRDDRNPQVIGLGTHEVTEVVVAEGRAVDGAEVQAVVEPRIGLEEITAVDSGAKGSVPGSGDDHTADVPVASDLSPQLPELMKALPAQGVQGLRPLDSDLGHAITGRHGEGAEFAVFRGVRHRYPSSPLTVLGVLAPDEAAVYTDVDRIPGGKLDEQLPEVEGLVTRIEGPVLTMRIDREGTLNSLGPPQRAAIVDTLNRANTRRDIRAVLLTGTGRAFCSGADLSPATGYRDAPDPIVGDLLRLAREGVQQLVLSVLDCEKPVVAAVNGVAAGVGASLALACDLVVASDDARFVQAFVRRGLVPDGAATWLLPRLVGVRRAMEMVLLGEAVGAEQAVRLGLVNRVVASSELMRVARELASTLADGPTIALGLSKRMVNDSLATDLRSALRAEACAVELAARTDDAREGVASFREHRAARFSGR